MGIKSQASLDVMVREGEERCNEMLCGRRKVSDVHGSSTGSKIMLFGQLSSGITQRTFLIGGWQSQQQGLSRYKSRLRRLSFQACQSHREHVHYF